MTLPEVTYSDYEGALSEERFDLSLKAAKAYVRELIGFNEPANTDQITAYKAAVCAAVDVDAAYGASGGIGEGLASLSIGSVSFSSGSQSQGNATNAYKADIQSAIRRELVGSGLLYQGLA